MGKKIIGYSMLLIAFSIIFGLIVIVIGFKPAILLVGVSILLTAFIIKGIELTV